MSHKIFRLFVTLIIMVGLVAVEQPRTVEAAGPWYVSTTGDDNNDCLDPSTACATINAAIGKASAGDIVNIAAGTYTGSDVEVVLIDKDINLLGGWDDSFTAQSGTSTIDGQGARRGITVYSGVTAMVDRFVMQNGLSSVDYEGGGGVSNSGTLTLSNSTISRSSATGYATGGGAVFNANSSTMLITNSTIAGNTTAASAFGGGGIYNTGTLTLSSSTVTGNSISGIHSPVGGGIYNRGTMTLNNSSVNNNNAGIPGEGGGISNSFGTMTINNSTVSKNVAGNGAGIYSSGPMNVNSSTISDNTSTSIGGVFNNSSDGGFTFQNTIIANNTGIVPDCNGFTFVSEGYNIIGNATNCNFALSTGDIIDADPKLGQLMGNPGYRPLLPDSPAIDAGNPAGCAGSDGLLTTDQRGAPRTGICDIGAYEYTTPGSASQLFIVSGDHQRTAPTFAFPKSLQAAALDDLGSPVPGLEITFTAPGSGPSGTFSDTGSNTTTAVTDQGGVATAVTLTANDQFGEYTVSASADGIGSVDFSLMNGMWFVANTGDDSNDCSSPSTPCATINAAIGKADPDNFIFVASGTYTGSGEEQVVLVNKNIVLLGGWDATFSIQNGTSIVDGQQSRRGITVGQQVTLLLDRFMLQNGRSFSGGSGLTNFGAVTINDSSITRNSSITDGGGILNLGSLIINNSSITNNQGGSGGGIANGSSGFAFLATTILNNSTISGNSASSRGGGIGNSSTGTLVLNNTTVFGNQDEFFPGGGGIYNGGGSVTVQNSIIAGNTKINDGSSDCDGTIISLGYNLIGSTSGCAFSPTTGDQTDLDPNLGQLIGPSASPVYNPLLPGSPAIDAGNPSGCTDQDGNALLADQRGVARVGVCDIGAYEFTNPGPATNISVAGGDPQSAATTFAFPELLRVAALDEQGSPVSGVNIDFVAPAAGPSGTFTDTGTNITSAVTDQGGVATASVFTANDQQGSYIVTASAAGLGSAEFHLEQISRPLNDNLAHAEPILALPFNDILDNTNATREPGEQFFCGGSPLTSSVWYSFTPATTVTLRADMLGSSFEDMALTIYQSFGPGFNNLGFIDRACGPIPVTFTAQAGATYYLQAVSTGGTVGELHLNVEALVPPPNDDFENAEEIVSLPASVRVDISAATTQPSEPQVCIFMNKTVWYVLHPAETRNIRFDTNGGISGNLNIYRATGNDIMDLQFLQCSSFFNSITLEMQAGETYYIQAGPSFDQPGELQLNLSEVATISGRVTDETTGTALPGNTEPFALVTLQLICGPGCLQHVASQNADGDGRFVFDSYFGNPLPTGSYQVEVSANSYQTEQFGPFEFTGSSLDVGDLPLSTLALIGSISGRVVDAVTTNPIATDFEPGVFLLRCDPNCSFVNSASLGSDGRFHFETDFSGNRLLAGEYQIQARADQYFQAETAQFTVGETVDYDTGDIPLTSFPVRFSELQDCGVIPAAGGECEFSVRVSNGTDHSLNGKTWSMANVYLPESFIQNSNFQVKDAQDLDLGVGRSKLFRFRLKVPENHSSAAGSVCTSVFVGEGNQALFNTIGSRNLFCITREGSGFAIVSPNEVQSSGQTLSTEAVSLSESEPNNSCQAAQDMGVSSDAITIDGLLDAASSDIDFFRFSGTPGTRITIDHEGQATGKGTLGDPLLGFYDSTCSLITFNDDSTSLNSHLEITVPFDGVFILAATAYPDFAFDGGEGDGTYQLTVVPETFIGSISGVIVDADTGQPLSGQSNPFTYVWLYRCDMFGCIEVNDRNADEDGRFHFETDYVGTPLPTGQYYIRASASQYQTGSSAVFTVGRDEQYDVGNVPLQSYPVRFSDVEPCSVPTTGGICEFKVRVTNGLDTRLNGKVWNVIHGFQLGSFANFTRFQADTVRDISLDPGRSTLLRFRFQVRGAVQDGAVICVETYVGQNPDAFYNTVGEQFLFCFEKGSDGFTLLSPAEMYDHMQQEPVQEVSPLLSPSHRK